MGKTYAACRLLDALFARGVKVAPFKPIETGVDPLPLDAVLLRETARKNGLNLSLETVCPIRFALPAAPAVARNGAAIDWIAIDRGFEACQQTADLVLIEGAGGAFAPIDDEFFSIDLAARYNARVLVIAGDQLGTIHNLLTTIEAIGHRVNIVPLWAINAHKNVQHGADFERVTEPYLTKKFGTFWRIDQDIEVIANTLCR